MPPRSALILSPICASPPQTIPGCVNDWGPFGNGSGVVEPTCETKAALAEWDKHAAAADAARDTLQHASNYWPDKADPSPTILTLAGDRAASNGRIRQSKAALLPTGVRAG